MTDPDRDQRQRDRSIGRMSWIVFILAFLVLLLSIIYNWPTPAAGISVENLTRSL